MSLGGDRRLAWRKAVWRVPNTGHQHITDWVHVTRPAAATGAGTRTGSLGGRRHPSAELTLGSRGVMNRRTLAAIGSRIVLARCEGAG